MRIVVSTLDRAAQNCAFEQQFFCGSEDVLLLYVNRPAVVIGKNQIAEAEADLDFCRRTGIDVVRRISGGGAVYHDTGNINYAFIMSRTEQVTLDVDYTAPVRSVLNAMGLVCDVGRRREIIAGGAKISGTASHFSRNRVLFHGTLLYDTDLNMLHNALHGDVGLRRNGVASVPSHVANVRELLGCNLSASEFLEELRLQFEKLFAKPKRDL